MQEKIQKLFSFFKKMKNEPFYTSIISQIIQIYETCPQSLKFILYNLNQLIFTDTKQVKLRLKHRQICASIVAKLNTIYVQRIKNMIDNDHAIDLQNFQLELDTEGLDAAYEIQGIKNWKQIQLLKIVNEQEILLSTEKGSKVMNNSSTEEPSNQNKIFEEYINMKQATMINIQEIFKDVKSDKSHTEEAFEKNKNKYQTKIDKIKAKKLQYEEQAISIGISNPFNLLYQICIQNILSLEWELRHLSTLILKELLHYPQFLGFTAKITLVQKNLTREQRFSLIEGQTKQWLEKYMNDTDRKAKILNQTIVLNMKLLCLDRFADYQADQSNIIVRNKSAEILAKCYNYLVPGDQILMLKKLKVIFAKQSKIGNQNDKFTWEVKHSFMAFINIITDYPDNQINVYKLLQQNMIKMLISEQQIDEIVLAICKCFRKFIGQKFFGKAEIQRVNQQVWKIVKYLDDISVSTVSALELLGAMFPFYNLNVCNSLEYIRKFFISKIPDVRKQFYNLLSLLYNRKFTVNTDQEKKLIQSNIKLFLQASIVEYDTQIFQTLKELSPNIFTHIRKERKMFDVVIFVCEIVLREDYTERLIQQKFEIFDSFNLDKNDYLYIYQLEKSHITVDKYVDKRIWKFAEIIASGFKDSYEGFVQLITEIEKQSKNTYRTKLFILHLMAQLVDKYKKEKLFEEYLSKVVEMMKYQFCTMNDFIIAKIKSYFTNTLAQLSEKCPKFKQKIQSISANLGTSKQISIFHTTLLEQYENPEYDQQAKEQIEILINSIISLIEHQRTLFKQIKILSTCYFVKIKGFSADTLNIIVGSIKQALQEDKYCFISQYGAETLQGLSFAIKQKKASYVRIIGSVLTHVSQKYQKKDMNIAEQQNGYNLKAEYMLGINKYIQSIGIKIPQWLQTFQNYFITQYTNQQQKQDPNLFLLSGTIKSLLKICSNDFLKSLLEQLDKFKMQDLNKSNKQLFYKILEQCFLYFCDNFNEKSNIFFEWFVSNMKEGCSIFMECLMKVSEGEIFRISGVCSLFVLQVVKQISNENNKEMAILCLSNVVVGVYMNTKVYQFSQQLTYVSECGIDFVKNFKDASNFNYEFNIKLKEDISLREYQNEGIQWLGFLCKFNLNGALCDDMGLGKTLQTFCLIENQYKKRIQANQSIQPTLIVVPTTLTQHWAYQYSKYFVNPLCRTVVINKLDLPTQAQIKKSKKPLIFITSYQNIEKKIDAMEKFYYRFIVLDQGHIIKNPKTLKFLAVKRLRGLHRFILTGTPIQNRLKQLWSLFDFLMPGYLYTKQTFKNHYEKLFEVNLTTFKQDELLFTEQQKRILQKLHLKVMPFIMRRMKSDVLKQLPEKIINDYYCEMTDIQKQLYQQFEDGDHITKGKDQSNILASLSKIRKILNHPNLVGYQGQCEDSGKFIAINQLFEQLGFREQQNSIQNKVIVFSRSNKTIDLLQKLFMKAYYPKLKYLKLTASSVKQNQRFMVAQNFNGDSDIKVLLVTTAVGGQGLNLSSANTVIMFDHDYNPTVDMQAIDRAHRIGQKRTLNVYRLITKKTLEQRIMGIQKFKKNLAQAIVNIDNASIKNIQQSKLPQLLENIRDLGQNAPKDKIKQTFYNQLVEEMQHGVIEEHQYSKEY